MKAKTLISVLLFTFAAWQFSHTGYMLTKAWLSQVLIASAWDKTLQDQQTHKPWSWADTHPMAVLNFPRLEQRTYVLAGSNGRNLAFSATHMSQSGLPGQTKSTLISGHNDSHFSFLEHLKFGDEIVVELPETSLDYCINSMQVINSHKQKLVIKNTDEIILSTCYPFNTLSTGSELRYVIYASPCNKKKLVTQNI